MNSNPQTPDSMGYLIVKVTTARGAIPLENASVNIRGGDPENSGVMYGMRTNQDGQTEKVALPAPPRSASESPGNIVPYSSYNIDVFKEGYVPLSFQNVPIFPSIVSIQPAVMVPEPEYFGNARPHYAATVIPEAPEADL